MNVYPVNTAAGARVSASGLLQFSDIKNIFHPYLKHRAYFSAPNPVVQIRWDNPAEFDTVIVADTNRNNVELELDGSLTEMNLPDEINIFTFDDPQAARSCNLYFGGNNENACIGYVFIGKKVELPRFATGPQRETTARGSSERTGNGQAYGNLMPALDQLSVSFLRVYKDKKKIVDDYFQAVQTSIPHIVDLYPEAHEAFPPVYATLNGGPSAVKRAENDFYWDFNLSWLEAR